MEYQGAILKIAIVLGIVSLVFIVGGILKLLVEG